MKRAKSIFLWCGELVEQWRGWLPHWGFCSKNVRTSIKKHRHLGKCKFEEIIYLAVILYGGRNLALSVFNCMRLKQLTQKEYSSHIENKTLRLAFIGMSNAGKSYRAKVLRDECEFMWYHVDGEIQKTLGFKTMEEISEWLGYPTSSTYLERERKYLDAEDKYTMINTLDTGGKNLVSDTTGSVIYLKADTHNWLEENCLMVNIQVDEKTISELIKNFFEKPKPVIWQGFFNQKENESEREALERCYPKLLSYRLEKYRTMAHVNIPAEKLYNTSGQETLDVIKPYLEK